MVSSATRLLAAALLAAVAALIVLPAAHQGQASGRSEAPRTADVAFDAPRLTSTVTRARGRTAPPAARFRGYTVARIRAGHSIALRAKPGGEPMETLGARTEFGSKRVLGVAAVRGRWLGVSVPDRPNGKLGWIDGRSDAVVRDRTKVSVRADLSRRTVELRVGRRTVERMRVSIGRPGSSTPTGRFAVTDKISGDRYGPYYGCCILALSGTQPNLPAGWSGGNRLAIHGTNAPGTIGAAASAGCLRGGEADLRTLMRRVPVGAPVFIRP
jgi:lipoprotein-anchoring transpeptidase ErfK/SrfK